MQLETLVEKFQLKEETAFDEIYTMYAKSIYGVIYNIIRDEQISQEVLQDVFIKAWNKADSYSNKKGRFYTWLLNIARNSAIDTYRSKDFKNTRKNFSSELFVDLIPEKNSLDSQTDSIGLRDVVKSMGEKCKQVIEYLYFKGYTQQETSDEIAIPLGTIKTRIRRCLQELKQLLGE